MTSDDPTDAATDDPGRTPRPTDPERVVSLAPSATAVVAALGAADLLVGVTAHCQADAPAVAGWPDADPERVLARDPDLVLTADPLQRETRDALRERGLPVHHVEPRTLDGVLDSFHAVGDAVGRPSAGASLADDCRRRIERIRAATPDPPDSTASTGVDETAGTDPRPVVYCEEWGDPPMAAGNWVPEAVEAAGGRYPFVASGDRSRAVSGSEVASADPDHAVLHPGGPGAPPAAAALADRGWDLAATVHIVDDDLLNQPSPLLVDGIETLAERVHGVAVEAE